MRTRRRRGKLLARASTAGDGDATQQPDLRSTHSLRVLHGGLGLQRVKSGKTSVNTSLAAGKSSLTQPHKPETSLTAGKTSLKVSKVGLTTNLMKPICGRRKRDYDESIDPPIDHERDEAICG